MLKEDMRHLVRADYLSMEQRRCQTRWRSDGSTPKISHRKTVLGVFFRTDYSVSRFTIYPV
jgi:hypothetical protein